MRSMSLLLLLGFVLSGCASILNDDTQKINITTSNNTEIKGNIDGVPFTGPGIVSVKRAKADRILASDTPACNKQTLLHSSVDTKFYINILSGGTFGSSTDYSTDKMWKYEDTVLIPCK